MKTRYVIVASAVTGIMALSGCSDDAGMTATSESPVAATSAAAGGGQTTLVRAKDVELVGGPRSGLGDQTLNITATEENGQLTGEFRISRNVMGVDCADTSTDGVVILGGEATDGPDVVAGELFALAIREGEPDSVALYGNDSGAESCSELIESIPEGSLTDDDSFSAVEDGYNIKTS